MRVETQWNRLPREAVAAPFLEAFEARLDGAFSNVEGVPAHGGEVVLDDL